MFAAKCQRFRELTAALHTHFIRQEAVLVKLPDRLTPPPELSEQLDLPWKYQNLPAVGKTWDYGDLHYWNHAGVQGGYHLYNDGSAAEWIEKPIAKATRKRIAEILQFARQYELDRKRRAARITRIEATSDRPLQRQQEALLDALTHPVFTVAEVLEKIHLTEEDQTFENVGEDVDAAREAIFRDIRAIARLENAHV